jgi:hypothetical protein
MKSTPNCVVICKYRRAVKNTLEFQLRRGGLGDLAALCETAHEAEVAVGLALHCAACVTLIYAWHCCCLVCNTSRGRKKLNKILRCSAENLRVKERHSSL